MDDFGVLVESIGFKAHGRSSAPLADLKGKTNINNGVSRNFGISSGFDAKPLSTNKSKSAYNSNSVDGSFVGDLDGIFQSSNSQKTQKYGGFDGFDDVFGGPTKNSNPASGRGGSALDLDTIFKGSNNFKSNSSAWNTNDDDDIFGGMPGLKSSTSVSNDDVFGTMQSAPVNDLLGNFGGMGLKSNVSRRNSGNVAKNAPKFDDLIPGFGGSSPPNNGANSETSWPRQSSGHSAKSTPTSAEDPFVVLETSSSLSSSSSGFFSDSFQEDAAKKSVPSAIDELEDFAKGTMHSNANEQPDVLFAHVEAFQTRARDSENDLESFFSKGAQQTTKPRPSAPTVDPMFDVLFNNRGPKKEQTSTKTFSGTKKAPSVTNITEDFSFMFGAPPSEKFQEIEGESDERRRARLNHHLRTQARVAKALADKNERDFQTQQDQEERHRLSDTLNDDIKRWAAGKEGNLRALLSSLQNVLWPECGWQQVSLTDLITSVSVKKVYYKATLCVHPDKVQQKGATIRQKYIAEKVFDLLKEAWNKFNSEEL